MQKSLTIVSFLLIASLAFLSFTQKPTPPVVIWDYLVISDDYADELQEEVNKHLVKGWQPQGGVSTTAPLDYSGKPAKAGEGRIHYFQALVRAKR